MFISINCYCETYFKIKEYLLFVFCVCRTVGLHSSACAGFKRWEGEQGGLCSEMGVIWGNYITSKIQITVRDLTNTSELIYLKSYLIFVVTVRSTTERVSPLSGL